MTTSCTYPPFLERIDKWRENQGDKPVFKFVDDNAKEVSQLTYSELYAKSTAFAHFLLKQKDIKAGENVLLVYPPGLDFIIAFIGCLRANVVAVPVYPPDPLRLKKDIFMFTAVAADCKAKIALTNSYYDHAKKAAKIKDTFSFSKTCTWPELQWIVTDSVINSTHPTEQPLAVPNPNDVAFLQYTSGSTENPKGVMITFNNLAHNLYCITKRLKATNETIVVSWLPQYHDMGLIGAYLGILYSGGFGVYMSPFSFIKNPPLWMQLISEYKATHIQGPNFAYKLAARKFKPKNQVMLDLSSLQHAINAAEPIDSESIDLFYDTFRPYGLKDGVLVPTYGLAEHTVYVCDGGTQRVRVDAEKLQDENTVHVSSEGKEYIGCGYPNKTPGLDIRIVPVHGKGDVGEIWLDSPSKALGYYGMKEKTTSEFHATVADNVSRTYLRTGDIGFLYNDELFICGRLKDLIIIRGRNHFPQDIEKSVESFQQIRPGCSAAFSIQPIRGGESLVIVAEIRSPNDNPRELCKSIRQTVSRDHGISVGAISLLSAHTISKTTSGKISRHRCKRVFLANDGANEIIRDENWADNTRALPSSPISSIGPAPSDPDDVLKELVQETAQLLDIELTQVDPSLPLQQLGMDSLALTQIKGLVKNRFHTDIEETVMYDENTTLHDLHRTICPEVPELPIKVQKTITKDQSTCCGGCVTC